MKENPSKKTSSRITAGLFCPQQRGLERGVVRLERGVVRLQRREADLAIKLCGAFCKISKSSKTSNCFCNFWAGSFSAVSGLQRRCPFVRSIYKTNACDPLSKLAGNERERETSCQPLAHFALWLYRSRILH